MEEQESLASITVYGVLFEQLSAYLAPEQVKTVQNAYELAVAAHQGQKRASGEDYIIHPVGVAYILAGLQMDVDSIVTALLHDVVEDTDTTIDLVKEKFGPEVALLVDGLTKLAKIEHLSKEDQQAENYSKMFLAMAKDIRVVLIKLADRLHNMRTLDYMPSAKQKATARETLDLFAPLAHRLGIHTIKWELEDLAFRFLEPETYADLSDAVQEQRREREAAIAQAIELLQKDLGELKIECRISGRAKNLYSIHRKMQRDHKELSEIYDLSAIRVLVDTVKDCYGSLGAAHTLWKPLPGRFKDYIAMPKSNMYQSLHTTVMSTQGKPLEIQIRTQEMHRIAEYGIAAHWRYKEGVKASGRGSFEDKLSWLRQMLEWHKDVRDTKEFVDTVMTGVFVDKEVFVFTPRGDVIDLPSGAVPIDFAYRIHTDVGNRCVGAKVNGRIVPLEHKLSNGDIVEVITSKQTNGPSRDWLKIVVSSESKSKIRAWFKKALREESVARGREMLERESKRLGYDTKTFLRPERLKSVALKFNLISEENLLASLGYGSVTVPSILTKLVEWHKAELNIDSTQEIAKAAAEIKPKSSKSKASQGILVKGESGLLIRLARCCSPVPGDRITGYITRGRGVSVHRSNCVNVLNNNDEFARLVEVSWDIAPDALYRVSVEATTVDRPGVLAEIMNVTSEIKVNVSALNVKTNHRNKTAHISMEIEINALYQLEHILSNMRRIKDIISVERHSAQGD